MADEDKKGALSQLGGSTDLMSILSELAKTPASDDSSKYYASAAGWLKPTKSGTTSESMGSALKAYSDSQDNQAKLRAQYVPHITSALLDAAKFQEQQRINNYVQGMFANGGGAQTASPAMPGQLGSGMYGSLPVPEGMPEVPAAPTQSRKKFPLDINQIAEMKFLTGKDVLPEYKAAMEGFERKPGSFYSYGDGTQEYIGDPTKGINFKNGVVSPMAGAASTFAQMEGEKVAAQEAAKARYQLAPEGYSTFGAEGVKLPRTVSQVIDGTMPGNAPPTPQPGPTVGKNGFPTISPDVQRGRDAEALEIAKQDIAMAATPQDKAQATQAYQNMLARYNAGQSVITGSAKAGSSAPPMELQTDAQKEAAIGTEKAKNAALEKKLKDDQDKKDKATVSFAQMQAALPMARDLLSSGPTASGAGALVDQAFNFAGKSTKSGDAASALDTLSGWMTSNVPRMEGPQGEKDVVLYKTMAAQVGDRGLPISTRLKALDVVERLQKENAQFNKVDAALAPGTQKNIEKPKERTIVRTGTFNGKKVNQYSDGSTEYAK